MRRFFALPLPQLCPFVDRLWGLEAADGELLQLPTLVPGVGTELYFHYGTPFRYLDGQGRLQQFPAAHLLCLRGHSLRLLPSTGIGFIAVRIKVGMIHRFTPVPGRDFLDRIPALEDLWGPPASALLRRLADAASRSEKLRLIQIFLLRQLREDPIDALVERGVGALYAASSSLSVDALAERLRLGRRQLERRFLATIGQSPRDIRRLTRFHLSVRDSLLDPSTNPTDIALTAGYYDQAHFIRDFQALAGTTPGRFLSEARAKTHFYNTSLSKLGIMRTPLHLHDKE